MTLTVHAEIPPAVRRGTPAAHQVAFREADDRDRAGAWCYLLAGMGRAGCTPASAPAGPATAVTLELPAGGTAVLAIGGSAGDLAGPGHMTASLAITDPGRSSSGDLDAILAVLDSLPFTSWELDQIRDQMPVTACLAGHLGPAAFADVAVLCAIHHLRDFTAMAAALTACGARPGLITVIDKGYPYRMRGRVDGWLRHKLGATVVPYPARVDGIRGHLDRAAAAGARTLVFDDGGYCRPCWTTCPHGPGRSPEWWSRRCRGSGR